MSFPSDSFDYSSHLNNNILPFLKNHLSSGFLSSELFSSQLFQKNFFNFKKSGPVYSMHRYWTKQPIDIIEHFINYFCPPNGIVMDPFCGTGTTGTAALLSNRKIILSDLSPIATFIAKNYTERTDINTVKKAVSYLSTQLSSVFNKFYQTICPSCSSNSLIRDWIYAENYICPSCSSIIPFISDHSDWSSITSLKHSKTVRCPDCDQTFNRSSLITSESYPLGLRYSCPVCKVRKNFKQLSSNDRENLIDPQILSHQSSLIRKKIPFGTTTNQAINKNILYVDQFFTPVTFFILSKLWELISEFPHPTRQKLQFIFTSIMYRVTKLYRLRVKGQGGILSGTLYIPPLFQDINVWDVFLERFRKISKGWSFLNSQLPQNFNQIRIISTHSATKISIPDNSIDYVYTDPPYGGNINYSELNFLWEYWFNLFTDKTDEVIINELGQNKDLVEYEKLFSSALAEIFRVLKPGAWCSLVFNSSSPKVWSSIQGIISNSKFLLSSDIIPLDSKMTTAKQTQSLKTARRYLVLNLFKPNNGNLPSKFSFVSRDSMTEEGITKFIISEIHKLFNVRDNLPLGYDKIYEYILPLLLTKYHFSDFNLESILNNNFKSIGSNYWTLL